MGNTFERNYEWGNGNIEYNTLQHRDLNYKREPFNDPKSIEVWKEMGFSQDHFTGEMYDMKNPKPDWFDFDGIVKHFDNWTHLSWSFYKMTSGVVLPRHVDEFVRFKEMYPDAKGTLGRILIMLEDRKLGHYLDLGEEIADDWRAGDYFWWTEFGPHTAANIGSMDRYTLQLTGFEQG